MSFPNRQTIAVVGAILGANLPVLLFHPTTAQSEGLCDGIHVNPAAVVQQIQRTWRKPVDPLDGRNYWENDVWADRQPQTAAVPVPVPPQPVARTQNPAPVPAASAVSTGDPVLDAQVEATTRAVDNGTYRPATRGGY